MERCSLRSQRSQHTANVNRLIRESRTKTNMFFNSRQLYLSQLKILPHEHLSLRELNHISRPNYSCNIIRKVEKENTAVYLFFIFVHQMSLFPLLITFRRVVFYKVVFYYPSLTPTAIIPTERESQISL